MTHPYLFNFRHQSCVPTRSGTKLTEISVWLYPFSYTGAIEQPECSIAYVEEHTECECGCSTKPEDCIAGFQKFDENRCECTCLDRAAEEECYTIGKLEQLENTEKIGGHSFEIMKLS